jgi:MoaA/NifB/PqqE/SkfB family radical SAM enzyme
MFPIMRLSFWGILQNRIPGQLVIQVTDRCNALCPQCGMRVTEAFSRSTLPADDVKRIIDHAAQNGVKAISFTGGEPLLDLDTLVSLIEHAGRAGIDFIRTGTNGYLFRHPRHPGFETRVARMAEKLARTPLRNFWISIDSAVPAVHERMRGFPGVVAGIQKALPIFHEHGLFPTANLGLNRNIGGHRIPPLQGGTDREAGENRRFFLDFKHAFREFYRFVIAMGFTVVNTCYPMSIEAPANDAELDAVYRANARADLVRFSVAEKALLFKALLEVVPEFRARIRIFSPLCSLYALYRQQADRGRFPSYACRGGSDFFFINAADGNAYPCGYRGNENLGKYWSLKSPDPRHQSDCNRCEWECFRDPSVLFGPLLEAFSQPRRLWDRLCSDRTFFRYWVADVRYYRACGFFNGRRPPDPAKMKVFDGKGTKRFQPAWTIRYGKNTG